MDFVPTRQLALFEAASYPLGEMTKRYMDAALRQAHYELLDDDEGFHGKTACCPGVLASAETLEGCRNMLAEVREEWILVRISRGLPLPEIAGQSWTRIQKTPPFPFPLPAVSHR